MSTLTLKKLQIGKSNNPENNIVISTPIEDNGITTIYSGNLEELVQELIIINATDGLKLFKPSVLDSIAAEVLGKELVSAEWVLSKLTPIIAQASLLLPIGSVIYYPIATPPSNYMKCNGAAINRTTYNLLFGVINTIYGAGNGSTTFNVPELRGEFIRGFDDGRGIDAGRSIGSWQNHSFESHTHNANIAIASDSGASANFGAGTAAVTGNRSVSLSGGTETRPRNVVLMPIIKYQ